MKLESSHDILGIGPDFESAKKYVLRFLDKTQLVKYDSVEIEAEHAIQATQPGFWERIEEGMEGNRQMIDELLEELKESGIHTLDDLRFLQQGYQSKTIHTVTHILDGFFGIDSVFYSPVEDSHWVSPMLKREILNDPSDYWLIKATGSIKVMSRKKAAIMRKFESYS